MLCEPEIIANSDVFELAVAQNTAIYSVFEQSLKKHRYLRRFANVVAENAAICCFFLTVSRNAVKPRQRTKNTAKTTVSSPKKLS